MPGWRSMPVVYQTYEKLAHFDGINGTQTTQQIFSNSAPAASGGAATMGSLFYMLVKYQDVSPKQFICKGDSGSEVFKLSTYTITTLTDLTKVYDFGYRPGKHCSYAYHFPFSKDTGGTQAGLPISVNSSPSSPLAADRNPGLDKNAFAYITGGDSGGTLKTVTPLATSPCLNWVANGCQYVDKDFVFNAYAHQREGQNVLRNDGSVKFEPQANAGINNDNIYQRWGSGSTPPFVLPVDQKSGMEACGRLPTCTPATVSPPPTTPGPYTDLTPADVTDALLINDLLDNGS